MSRVSYTRDAERDVDNIAEYTIAQWAAQARVTNALSRTDRSCSGGVASGTSSTTDVFGAASRSFASSTSGCSHSITCDMRCQRHGGGQSGPARGQAAARQVRGTQLLRRFHEPDLPLRASRGAERRQ